MNISMLRTRWAAIGAAVAVTLGAGGLGISYAATTPTGATAYVPITPCRLADTRPAPDNVGPRNTPIGAAEIVTINAHGEQGNCKAATGNAIPSTATGLQLNVTALGATSGSFLTIWATGATQPTASSLNPQPGAPPIPNAVTTGVSGSGQFNIFNAAGSVNVLVDVVGYYTDHRHDSDNITNEAGIASDYKSTIVAATTTPAEIAGTSMRVPSDGYVEIQVTGHWTNGAAGDDEVFCQLQKGTVGALDFTQPWFALRDRNTSQDYTSFSAHRVMPIAVADNPAFPLFQFGQSLSLVCDEQVGDVSFDDVHVSATFFPTSYRPTGPIVIDLSEASPEAGPQASDG